MAKLQGPIRSVYGFAFIVSVTVFLLGFSVQASADQNDRCYQATQEYGSRLEMAMLKNRDCTKELQTLLNSMKKSAKRYAKNERDLQNFMKDDRISPKEAAKIQKMSDKSLKLISDYDEMKAKIKTCRTQIRGIFINQLKDFNRDCK